MDLKAIVTTTATTQALLVDGTERLQVSSITIVEFVVELEDASGIEIPNAEMRAENFESVSTVVHMLERLRAGPGLAK
ncbi:MAG TPA: hypothetical protein VIU61_29915 [Kofleriaceae bacterium]